MKAYEVLAIQNDGELVCWDCMTPVERRCANDRPERKVSEYDNISQVFASDIEGEELCSRCNHIIEGTEEY